MLDFNDYLSLNLYFLLRYNFHKYSFLEFELAFDYCFHFRFLEFVQALHSFSLITSPYEYGLAGSFRNSFE